MCAHKFLMTVMYLRGLPQQLSHFTSRMLFTTHHHCRLHSPLNWPSHYSHRQIHCFLFTDKILTALSQLHHISSYAKPVPAFFTLQFSAADDSRHHLQQTLKFTAFIIFSLFKKSIQAIVQDSCTCF